MGKRHMVDWSDQEREWRMSWNLLERRWSVVDGCWNMVDDGKWSMVEWRWSWSIDDLSWEMVDWSWSWSWERSYMLWRRRWRLSLRMVFRIVRILSITRGFWIKVPTIFSIILHNIRVIVIPAILEGLKHTIPHVISSTLHVV